MGCKKKGWEKQSHYYSKRQKGQLPLLFLNNNDLVFCTLLCAPHILDCFFKVPDPKKISGQPDKLGKVGAD